jgi:hypothetical protein
LGGKDEGRREARVGRKDAHKMKTQEQWKGQVDTRPHVCRTWHITINIHIFSLPETNAMQPKTFVMSHTEHITHQTQDMCSITVAFLSKAK